MRDTDIEKLERALRRAQIKDVAYCIWVIEGRPEGRALNNWLDAKRELRYEDE